jgi:hypothetical protein
MAMKQPIDRTVINGVSDTLFKSLPDLPHRRDLPTFGLRKKRSEEYLLFFQGEILPSSSSFAWRFNHRDAGTIVARDHRMNGGLGHATVSRNSLSLTGSTKAL